MNVSLTGFSHLEMCRVPFFELSQTERKSPATFCFRPTDTVIMSHFSKLPRKIEDKGLFRS